MPQPLPEEYDETKTNLSCWKDYAAGFDPMGDERPGVKRLKQEKVRCVSDVRLLAVWRGRRPPLIRITAEMELPLSDPLVICRLLQEWELRSKWDDNIAFVSTLEHWPQESWGGKGEVHHTGTKPVMAGLISPRDFLTYQFKWRSKGLNVACARQFPGSCHPHAPARGTRADLHFWAIAVEPITKWSSERTRVAAEAATAARPRQTAAMAPFRVTYWVQLAIKGWLPQAPVTKGTNDDVSHFLGVAAGYDWSSIGVQV
jgi:hypothetical protein